jgi:hypothetical protein
MAKPIPREAPVIQATLFCKVKSGVGILILPGQQMTQNY